MNALVRMAGITLVMGLLILSVFGLHIACSSGDLRWLIQESRRYENLEEQNRATWRLEELHRQAVQEWMAQRCTLAETIQQLRELNREFNRKWHPHITIVQGSMPEPAEEEHHQIVLTEEHLYQLILNWIEGILHGRPEELAAVRRRLEREYQQFQAVR